MVVLLAWAFAVFDIYELLVERIFNRQHLVNGRILAFCCLKYGYKNILYFRNELKP